MKQNKGSYRFWAGALAAVFCIMSMAGCGKDAAGENPGTGAAPVSSEQIQTVQTGSAESSQAGEETGTQPAAEAVEVSSIEELVEAITPGAEIVVKPGKYNLTTYLEQFSDAKDMRSFNATHPHVRIVEVFDGLELWINGVKGLHIEGGSEDPSKTEIVTEPRYAALLHFERCQDIELARMTLGHTDTGDCSGNVLDFVEGRNVTLEDMDLYGCGVYGIWTQDGSGDFTVLHSKLRDCAYGPFFIYEGIGEYRFTDCDLTGSRGGGMIYLTSGAHAYFKDCRFGQYESNEWYFMQEEKDITLENCELMEPSEYPDYGDYSDYGDHSDFEPEYTLDPTRMEQLSFEKGTLDDSFWYGYAVVNPESGETQLLDYPVLTETDRCFFGLWFEDGKARIEYRNGDVISGTYEWECLDDSQGCIQCDDRNLYFSLYRQYWEDGSELSWISLQLDNSLIWLYS